MQIQDSFTKIFTKKKKVLVIMPHPDDTELYCGGTVARLIAEGIEVRVVKMTFGEKGCKQDDISPEKLKIIRRKEDSESMKALGIKTENNIYLDLGDGAVMNDIKTIGIIALQIRLFQPDLIITTNPEDMVIRFAKDENWINHTDHINTAKAVLNGSYPFARDISFFPEHFQNKAAKSHTCSEFLLTDFYNHQDNVYIDVTKYIETRVNAHAKHSSQYSLDDARDSADFFTKSPLYPKGIQFEKFRHVIAD